MKEILLRFWDIERKKMIYFDKLNVKYFSEEWGYSEECYMLSTGSRNRNEPKCIDCELMRYTGLKDKNGKKIYEGDIVTAWSQGSCGKFTIKWREDGGGAPMWILYPAFQNKLIWNISATREIDGHIYDRGLTVIGNIHENPELLEASDDI